MPLAYVYKITNILSGEFYIGSRTAKVVRTERSPEEDLMVHYFTSSKSLCKSIKDNPELFKYDILFRSNETAPKNLAKDEFVVWYYEQLLIKESFKNSLSLNKVFHDPDTYKSSWSSPPEGMSTMKDLSGNSLRVPSNDPRVISGQLVGVTKGMTVVMDANGVTRQVSVNDKRFTSGELSHVCKNKVGVKGRDGIHLFVDKNDIRFLNGELTALSKGRCSVRDIHGNTLSVPIGDQRILTGELQHVAKGTIMVVDKHGDITRLPKDDPGVLSGEYVSFLKGYIHKDRTCPHCGITGAGPNMTRYHFDNCKVKYRTEPLSYLIHPSSPARVEV